MAEQESAGTGGIRQASAIDVAYKVVAKLREVALDPEVADVMAGASIDVHVGSDGPEPVFHVAISRGGSPAMGTAPEVMTIGEEDSFADLSFNAEGHHIIALVAVRALTATDPDVMAKVQRILDDGDRTITEAATFPDDIRNSQPETKPFHFIDIPFEEGGPVNPRLPRGPHVLTQIDEFTAKLKNRGTDAEENVNNLSWLIHLFGDVHQPLHCIERISDLHPGGDRGGNSFKLTGRKNNLHSLWDSSVNVSQALTEEELADKVMEAHPRASLARDLAVTSEEKWARSSHALARAHAYTLRENPARPPRPSTRYVQNMEKVGRRQAALGGYRLADRLKEIFGAR